MMSEPRNTVRLLICRTSGRIQPFSTHLQIVERWIPSSLAVATTPYLPLGSIFGLEVIISIVLIYSGNCNWLRFTVGLRLVFSLLWKSKRRADRAHRFNFLSTDNQFFAGLQSDYRAAERFISYYRLHIINLFVNFAAKLITNSRIWKSEYSSVLFNLQPNETN